MSLLGRYKTIIHIHKIHLQFNELFYTQKINQSQIQNLTNINLHLKYEREAWLT